MQLLNYSRTSSCRLRFTVEWKWRLIREYETYVKQNTAHLFKWSSNTSDQPSWSFFYALLMRSKYLTIPKYLINSAVNLIFGFINYYNLIQSFRYPIQATRVQLKCVISLYHYIINFTSNILISTLSKSITTIVMYK